MGGLMWRPIHEESATSDEPWILAAGYTYCSGDGFRMHPDEPPLAKMWSALPLLAMDISVSRETAALKDGSLVFRLARTWQTDMRPRQAVLPAGAQNNWYFWPWIEGERFGELFVYRDNDGERLIVAGRIMQTALTLLTGVLIFLWTIELAGATAGVLALAMWCFNPVALAHGHLIQTDSGGALTVVMALWSYGCFLVRPSRGRVVIAGMALGVAVVTKLSALLLVPTYALLACIRWGYPFVVKPSGRDWLRYSIAFAASAYLVLLVVYVPHWSPAPALTDAQAAALEVPEWFRLLRPVLVPADFFKAVVLLVGSARGGHHPGYLLGQWSTDGWWYYYAIAILLKSPIALLLLSAGGGLLFAKRLRGVPFEQLVPFVGATVFLAVAVMNRMNIGIRHLLPVYALLPIGIAAQTAVGPRLIRIVASLLCAWMAAVAVWAHPFYIEYFNEFAGGAKNGYQYLLDSNLDWGQDVKRLKRYLDQNQIQHIYLCYFGAQQAIDYYGISNTRVFSDEAQQIHDGVLVVSAMALMQPEWSWLRHRQPVTRIGYTLFVYGPPG
jgi:4-amino-4-deoxy-L-arabinose transferase-like glycosyltransferase